MGDYGRKISNFNPNANYNLVRYGGDTPITEMELNETQMLLSHKVKALSQSVIGERFLEGGTISLNTDTNEFTIQNQGLINEGRPLYITKLKGTLNNDETIYLDIFDKEVDKDSEIKLNGNLQETQTVENHLLDPRLEGIETARRMQTCFDLVKATSRFEYTSNDPIINIGDNINQSKLGLNSKLMRLEGNSYQDPTTLAIEFVGTPLEDGNYLVEVVTTGENLFNINAQFEGCDYEVVNNSLEVSPRIANSWNGLTYKSNVKPNTDYTLQCEVEGKTMIHVLNENKEILAIGNRTTFNTGDNNIVYIVFHVGCGKTVENEKAIYRNISLTEGAIYKSYSSSRQSVLGLYLSHPLARIGEYADVLYQNAQNKWNIAKRTKTTKFVGSELINGKGWTLIQEGELTNCFILENACPPSLSNESEETNLNNYALPKSYSELWANDIEGSAISVSGHLVVRLSLEKAPTLEVFKTLLKTNPMEVTHILHDHEIIEDVQVSNHNTRMFSLNEEEVEEVDKPSSFTYKGQGNVIRINENRNGYTSKVHIEGDTTYSLPLSLSSASPYQEYDKKEGTITNKNNVEYREWEDVEVNYKMEKNTVYTVSFVAKTPLICEIPCAKVYPTLKAGEEFIHSFNSQDNVDFQFKIWSPINEVATIENLQLFKGEFARVPQVTPFSMNSGLNLKSVGENGEVDVQAIEYKYRGHFQPLTTLRSLPNGECDCIKENEYGVYEYHKVTEEITFTGRERLTLVELTEDKIVVDFVKALPKALPTKNGNTYCNTIQAIETLDNEVNTISILEGGIVRLSLNPLVLTTQDTTGVAKYLQDNVTTLVYSVEKEVFECNMFDVHVFKGETTVTLEGLTPSVFKCETRENEGVGVYTFNNTTNLMFTGVAPSKVTYVANFKPKLVEEEGHVYIPLATRVLGQLKDLRIFDPHKVDIVNEDKDLTTGIYTTVKALRQNGTLKYKSTLSDKDERGNYNRMTVAYYDVTGEVNFHTEKYAITYDLDGDIVSKELIKQW